MINVLIVEDEYTIALDIEERLKNMGFGVAGIAASYEKALPILLEKAPSIALLDINLHEGKSGIDLGKLINDKFNIPIIFLSAYSDALTFKEAQVANPMGFIVKPFKDVDLDHGIKLAMQRYNDIKEWRTIDNQTYENIDYVDKNIFIRNKGKLIRILHDEVLWLEAMENYTVVHTSKLKATMNSGLKNVLEKLNSKNFLRVHRSHAVALDKISKIEDNLIYINDFYLVVSRTYKKELLQKLNIF